MSKFRGRIFFVPYQDLVTNLPRVAKGHEDPLILVVSDRTSSSPQGAAEQAGVAPGPQVGAWEKPAVELVKVRATTWAQPQVPFHQRLRDRLDWWR